jgi:hypothetical protein
MEDTMVKKLADELFKAHADYLPQYEILRVFAY